MKNFYFSEPLLFLKGAVVFAVGPLNHQLSYLALAMVIDLIFGIQVALKEKNFRPMIMVKKFGIKTITYSLWIAMFHAFDMVAGLPDTARWSLILILVGLEIMSAIKNTSKLGYGGLADALEKLYLSLAKQKGGDSDVEEEQPEDKPKKRGRKKKSESTSDSDSTSV